MGQCWGRTPNYGSDADEVAVRHTNLPRAVVRFGQKGAPKRRTYPSVNRKGDQIKTCYQCERKITDEPTLTWV